jgi:hypothetical protein
MTDDAPHTQAYAPGSGTQIGWRVCDKCYGLFYANNQSFFGVCPAAGPHHWVTSLLYGLGYGTVNLGLPSQSGWTVCDKCYVLFYFEAQGSSVCPAALGGPHNGSYSFNYNLPTSQGGPSSVPTQPGWRVCDKCYGLFYGKDRNFGICPAAGPHHWGTSDNYCLYSPPSVA